MTVKTKDELKAFFANARNPVYADYVDLIDSMHVDYSLGEVFSEFLAINSLRGFWPYSSRNANDDVLDMSGHGRYLTLVGGITFAELTSGLPYGIYNGSSGYHYYNGTFTNITGNLTVGGWFNITSNANRNYLISKCGASGNLGFMLRRLESATYNKSIEMNISYDGTNQDYIRPNVAPTEGEWIFIVGRFIPSTEVSVFLNTTKYSNTSSIHSAIYASTANLEVGAGNGATWFLNGKAALCFISGAALSDARLTRLYNISKNLFL